MNQCEDDSELLSMSFEPTTEFVLRRAVVPNKIAQLLSEFRQTILLSLDKPFGAHQS